MLLLLSVISFLLLIIGGFAAYYGYTYYQSTIFPPLEYIGTSAVKDEKKRDQKNVIFVYEDANMNKILRRIALLDHGDTFVNMVPQSAYFSLITDKHIEMIQKVSKDGDVNVLIDLVNGGTFRFVDRPYYSLKVTVPKKVDISALDI